MAFFLRYLKPGKKNFFRMAASEKERINKLECRAKEAENALQQLRAYVELLKKKSSKLGISTKGNIVSLQT